MAIQREIWVKDIKEKLFPDNSFLAASIKDDMFVEDGKTVNLPQAGSKPGVTKNRSIFPAVATLRVDTIVSYDLDEFTTDPTHIRDTDAIEVSYDKRQSVLRSHIDTLNDDIAAEVAYSWAATQAANIVRTSGADRPAMVAGATGNRKKIALEDILAAKRKIDAMNLPQNGKLYMGIPSEMYNDLLEIDKILSSEYNQTSRLPLGVINSVFGFNFYVRNSFVSYTNAATPVLRAVGAADLTTANSGVLIWHSDFVRRALGSVKVYAAEDEPQYYGSIFSAAVRAGGRKAYSDETGIVAIVEAAGA